MRIAEIIQNKIVAAYCVSLIFLVANGFPQGAPVTVKGDGDFPAYTPKALSESGTYSNGVYKNRLLGFSINIPAAWKLMGEDVNKAIVSVGGEFIKERQPGDTKKAWDESIANTRVLFSAQLPQQASTFVGGVEINPHGWGSRKYAEFNRNVLLGAFPSTTLKRDLYDSSFGGESFLCFDVELPLPEGKVRQTYFLTARRTVFLFFVATYFTDEEHRAVSNVMATLSFEK